MNRDDLDAWLKSPHRTWRWKADDTDPDRYEGVATADAGLRWFRWTHVFGEDHGEHDVVAQTFAEFRRDGPPRAAPAEVVEQLRAWVEEHGAGFDVGSGP